MKKKGNVTFHEIQGIWNSPVLFWPVVLIATSAWITFFLKYLFNISLINGVNSARGLFTYLLLLGILFPLLLSMLTFVIEVRTDGLYIRLFPLNIRYKKIPYKNIAYYSPVSYSTIARFGGIGIRVNSRGEKIYNLGGNKGVEIGLTTGEKLVIGTNQDESLKKAIDAVRFK
ncbi:hypothetical protein E4665_11470 [Sporolactobacillus shoreae]|uniref:Bacterial Pleckstrin homology domain-containing protein n=1 Tax=Sporolactobacillus shoreae TaxID=1465501 RepID=A0A4Z0GMH7_9BACL|nr:DUF6141 family protein [Sporolactobacillus shoreae]TGA97712.1 hypothetical protein E4665_11470 [Sporolactobacillus shoreae]